MNGFGPVPTAVTIGPNNKVNGDGYLAGTQAQNVVIAPSIDVPGATNVAWTGDESNYTVTLSKHGSSYDVKMVDPGQPFRTITGTLQLQPLPTVGPAGTVPQGSYSGDYVLFKDGLVADYGVATATVDGSGNVSMSYLGADEMNDGVPGSGILSPNGVFSNATIHLFGSDEPQTDATYGFDGTNFTIGLNQVSLQTMQLRASMTQN